MQKRWQLGIDLRDRAFELSFADLLLGLATREQLCSEILLEPFEERGARERTAYALDGMEQEISVGAFGWGDHVFASNC